MLSGDVDILVGKGSFRIRQARVVKPIPSRVIYRRIIANTPIGATVRP